MSQKARKTFFRIGTVVVAGTLLYLGLRGVDFNSLGADLSQGRYIWAIPLFTLTLTSHFFRAHRWRLLLLALPENSSSTTKISVFQAFSSLMIGYMVNYVAPRFGEVVRTSHFAVKEKLPFSSTFGTVVAERLLDVLTLAACLLSIPIILGSGTIDLMSIITRPMSELMQGNVTEFAIVAVVGVVAVSAGLYIVFRRSTSTGSDSRFGTVLAAFRDGFLTLGRSGRPWSIVGLTLLIWVCYAFMAYIPLLIFNMTHTGDINFAGAWVLMLIGSVGMALPSPGGVGSYHFFTIQALVVVWGFSQETAASYAIFSHGGQMILHILVGAALILAEGSSWANLRSVSLQDATEAGIFEGSE